MSETTLAQIVDAIARSTPAKNRRHHHHHHHGERHDHYHDHTHIERHTRSPVLPELHKLEIGSGDGSKYTAFFVEEHEGDDELELTASLAGFYNARYVLEYLKHHRIEAPVGRLRFFTRKLCADAPGERSFVAFTIEKIARGDNDNSKHHFGGASHERERELTLEHVYRAAEALASIHARGFEAPRQKAREIVSANYAHVIARLDDALCRPFEGDGGVIERLVDEYFAHRHDQFIDAHATRSMVIELKRSFSSFDDEEAPRVSVFCHGNLSAETIEFNAIGEIIAINDWEFAHFGHVASDLCALMASSLAPQTRRAAYLRVLRRYFYRLADLSHIPFKLADIKRFYWRSLKRAVFFGLLMSANSHHANDESQAASTRRWEQLVRDAHAYEFGDYLSENEDLHIADD